LQQLTAAQFSANGGREKRSNGNQEKGEEEGYEEKALSTSPKQRQLRDAKASL